MNVQNKSLLGLVVALLVAALAWLAASRLAHESAPEDVTVDASNAGTSSVSAETGSGAGADADRTPVTVAGAAEFGGAIRIRGRVVDAYGDPSGEAMVGHVASERPVLTAPDGRFDVLLDPSLTPAALLVIAAGHAPLLTEVELPPASREHDVGDLQVSEGGRLRGVVTGVAGRGVSGTTVTLRVRWTGSWPRSLDLQTLLEPVTTAPDGSFEFSNLVPGGYSLIATAPGMQAVASEPYAVRDGEATTASPIVLVPGHDLSGVVLGPDDACVPGALVRVRGGTGGARDDERAESDADGRFRFDALPSGPLRVDVTRSGFLSYRCDDVDATAGAELVVRLESGLRITGTVVDARSGRPVQAYAASVRRIGDLDPSSNGTMAQQLARQVESLRAGATKAADPEAQAQQLEIAGQLERRLERLRRDAAARPVAVHEDTGEVTDRPDGRFSFDGLEEGLWAVAIASPAHCFARQEPVELRRGAAAPDLRFELEPGHGLSGVVVARGGAGPVVDATVELVRVTGFARESAERTRSLYPWAFARSGPPGVPVMTTRTDGEGRFAFAQVPPATYVVSVRHPKTADHDTDPIDLRADVRDVRIEVGARASLTGRVSNVPAGMESGVSILVLGGHGTMRTVTADPDRTYRVDDLQPGSYIVRAFPSDADRYVSRLFGSIFPLHAGAVDPEKIPDRDVTLMEGESRVFDLLLDLPPAGIVEGEVALNGQPGFAAQVILRPVDAPGSGGLSLRANCDEVGHFRVEDVPAGDYLLVLYGGSRQELHRQPITVASNETVLVPLAVETGGLRGTVSAPDVASPEELRGWVWVLPGADEVPADLYEYRRTQRVHRIRIRDGAFHDSTLTPGPATVVVDVRDRGRVSAQVVIRPGEETTVDLAAGTRQL